MVELVELEKAVELSESSELVGSVSHSVLRRGEEKFPQLIYTTEDLKTLRIGPEIRKIVAKCNRRTRDFQAHSRRNG